MRAIAAAFVLLLLAGCASMPGQAAPAPGGGWATPSPSPPDRVITPVLTEIMPNDARAPRHGGSAVVLLAGLDAQNAAQRNLALCRALFVTFDQATTDEVAIGARHGAEGDLELLRPIYWPTRAPAEGQPGADRCPQRVGAYDYPRRDVIALKLNLRGAGPYLVVEQSGVSESERVAAVIDLTRTPTSELDEAVNYFRDGFVHRGDIWRPDSYAPVSGDGTLVAYVGAPSGFLPQLIRAAGVAACPFGNLLDVCAD